MTLRAPRCGKHPSHALVGVCAFCLRERLAGLADVDCASDAAAAPTHSRKKKKNPSPGRAMAAQGPSSKPSGSRGADQSVTANTLTQVLSDASNVCNDPIAGKSFYHPRASDAQAHSRATTTTGADRRVSSGAVMHTQRNGIASSRKAFVEPTSSLKSSPRPNRYGGPNVVNGRPRDESTRSFEVAAGRPSLASATRPSIAPAESNDLPPMDIKMPISENNQPVSVEVKAIKKHAAPVDMKSPLSAGGNKQVQRSASSDGERNHFNGVLGVRGSHPSTEPRIETDASVKDAEIVLSDASPNHGHTKKTLSSLFSLDDAEFSAAKRKSEELRQSINGKGDTIFNGSLSAPIQNAWQERMSQRKCRHGSFSERVEPSAYLFPVPETGNNKPLSWLSSLFRRRKKKTHPTSVEALASSCEQNNGWDVARHSWEAPRPSSWEQFRFSSYEGPRSSWEPARPSWEGVMRTSDSESIFSGFDFFTDSMVVGREDMGFERKKLQDFTGEMAYGPDARRSIDIKRAGLKYRSSGPRTPCLDDRARTFLSAKPMLMQRDVSTQTTPPKSSDATEIFVQQRLQHDNQRRRQYAKPSHAVWSRVWSKTFSNSKWAFKHKHNKDRRQKEVGDAAVGLDEVQDRGSMTPGRSSFHEGVNTASGHQVNMAHFDDIKEHEAWDTFYSPLQQGRDMGNAVSCVAARRDGCVEKDELTEKARGSNISLENGLLKFYLTPVRGHGIQGKINQRIRGL